MGIQLAVCTGKDYEYRYCSGDRRLFLGSVGVSLDDGAESLGQVVDICSLIDYDE